MKLDTSEFLLFSGSSHPAFSAKVADELGVSLGKIKIDSFPDGEIGVRVLESVRGKDVFVIQSIAREPNQFLMELLIMNDAFKRASAGSVNVVLPYFGYARQDRRGQAREPITARMVADLLAATGVDRILSMDLHTEQIQGFFDLPLDNLYGCAALIERIRPLASPEMVVVAPDVGGIRRATRFAESFGVEFAVVDKRRSAAGSIASMSLVGDVAGRDVLLVDDVCSTGSTLKQAVSLCRSEGAKRVFVAVTHGLFCGKVALGADQIFATDTVPPLEGMEGVEVVSVAGLFAKAIRCVLGAQSISSLYVS